MPVQYTYLETGTVGTGSTIVPADNTIPQATEGDQYMLLAITPKKATNLLKIEVTANLAHTQANAAVIAALFQDSTVNALAAGIVSVPLANDSVQVGICYLMVANTTSAPTFKVRAGGSAAGTTTFNGSGGVQLLGGVLMSSMRITEIQV